MESRKGMFEGSLKHSLRRNAVCVLQEAKMRGQPVGSCLGLWGSVEAPGVAAAALSRLAAPQTAVR